MVTLQGSPRLIGVLILYIVLLAAVPFAAKLLTYSKVLFVLISVSLYTVMPPNYIATHLYWSGSPFHPLAWQMLFFLPMVAGRSRLHVQAFEFVERNRWVLPLSAVVLAIGAALKVGQGLGFSGMPWTGRYVIGGVAIGHSLVLLIFYMAVLSRLPNLWMRQPLKAIATIDRNSIYCFALSIVLTYFTGLVLGVISCAYIAYLIGCVLLVTATYVGAIWFERKKDSVALGLHRVPSDRTLEVADVSDNDVPFQPKFGGAA